MFEIITKVREITAAINAGQYTKVALLVGELLVLAFGPKPMGADAAGAGELDMACEALSRCCEHPPVAAPDEKGVDPATVIALIQLAVKLIAWWRSRK